MRLIDEQFLETPWYGSRQMARHLRRNGWCVGRHRIRRLMTKMGLAPIYQHPKTSEPHPRHKIHPYLLRHLTIDQPNQVWCADVTYIPMRRGFLYLVAIMDWASRKVLAWRLSNTMDAEFCVAALEDAITRFAKPPFCPEKRDHLCLEYSFRRFFGTLEFHLNYRWKTSAGAPLNWEAL